MADNDRPGSRNLWVMRRLSRFLWPYRRQVAIAMVALLIAAGTTLGFGWGLRWLIDDGFARADASRLDTGLLQMLGVVAVLAIATYGRAYFVTWLGERVAADIRKAVYDNVVGLSPGYFETARVGEVLSRLTTDTTVLQTIVGSSASMALRNLLMFVGGVVLMAVTSPRLTLLAGLVVVVVVVPMVVFGRKVRELSRESQDRLGDVGAEIDETLNAVRVVQAFNREDAARGAFARGVEAAFLAAQKRIRARSAMIAYVILFVFGGVGVILWQGGHYALSGSITAGQLSAFVFYAVVVAGSVGAISEFAADLQRAAGASERLLELMDARPVVTAPPDPVKLPLPAQGAVALENVSFFYPTRPDRPALSEVSFAVKPGETVAIVGPSGAGKTTIFQLLLRFYDPQSGIVRVDGVDVRRADPHDLRARLGIVPQDPVVFAANAFENIRYGRPEATDAEVRAAADAAAATEFLDRLPDGFNAFLGERGVRLSGGQRQRIAIARAILRNPALLLLDEATSALDAESERLVQAALDRLMIGRTVLVIAHRLATVQRADRILVLDQGRLVATGTHAQLIAEDGLYARLAALQFNAPG